ncbi:hypothetical protein RDI58_001092 [Solanum bulbocastanum]|uniref:Uncharacterized protein n=1 Tax=Solanum bulbocastanum TaxID=147425 RepID=A0AAN8YMW3_SOLBU
MDDIEEVFMKWNYIDKKPYDICHMIEEAILVAGIKYPHQFDKRKNRIIRMISNPSSFDDDDDEDMTLVLLKKKMIPLLLRKKIVSLVMKMTCNCNAITQ